MYCIYSPRAPLRIRCESVSSRTLSLRKALNRPGILLGPCCHDGLSAKLIENASFPFAFMSGFATSAAKLAAPDVGLMTYSEMAQVGRDMFEATSSLPLIGDGDTGYGNPLNVKRTVCGYSNAGFSGILIEDQVWPKSCGHVREKKVVGRAEAIGRIIAAVEARDQLTENILILARTDARQAESFEEALYRVQAFADAGADVIFIDALADVQEMEGFCSLLPFVPKMVNLLEGGGKTPILSPQQLESIGFKMAAYPLSLIGVSMNAMNEALMNLKEGRVPQLSFQEIQEMLGFQEYFDERDKYQEKAMKILEKRRRQPTMSEMNDPKETATVQSSPQESSSATSNTLEVDEVYSPSEPTSASNSVMVMSEMDSEEKKEETKQMATFARIVVTNVKTGEIKLETRIPIGFIQDISKFVPEMDGFDIRGIMEKADTISPSPVFTFTEKKNKTEIYLE